MAHNLHSVEDVQNELSLYAEDHINIYELQLKQKERYRMFLEVAIANKMYDCLAVNVHKLSRLYNR